MVRKPKIVMLAGAVAFALAAPAAAQFSDGYNFIKAVKDRNGNDAMTYLNKPGQPAINAKDPGTGETALHIVTRRHDTVWINALLARGADTELKDRQGMTPLLVAAQTGDADAARQLLASGANVNAVNSGGESPLILATHNRDVTMARLLLQNRANPGLADTVAGKTARDYATEDRRSGAVLKAIEDEAKPAKPVQVMGPTR